MLSLNSNYKQLKKAIVHTPGSEIERLIPWYIEHPLTFDVEYTRNWQTLRDEHQVLVNVLSKEIGTENVLQVFDLLRDIFSLDIQRKRILAEILPEDKLLDYTNALSLIENQTLEKRSADEIARDLLIGYPREWLTKPDGDVFIPIILPKDGMRHVRDAISVIPTGVILGSFKRLRRKWDPGIMRAIIKFHPLLSDSIFLDFDLELRNMNKNNQYASPIFYGVEGGNIQVLSSEAILIGASYAWSNSNFDAHRFWIETTINEIFNRDINRSIRQIYVVNIPNFQHFWHLDSVFNMIGPKSAIAMPYIFNQPVHVAKSLMLLIKKISQDMMLSGDFPAYPYNLPSETELEYSGKVEVHSREDYAKSRRGVKVTARPVKSLIDQLCDDGLLDQNSLVWAGGSPENFSSIYEHIRVAFREQSSQACNIFTIKPYNLVVTDQNPYTNAAIREYVLKYNGKIHIVPSGEQVKSEGGPHCLVADLERES